MNHIFSSQSLSNKIQDSSISSHSNRCLEKLEARIPVVSDKALVDLINGIQVSKDIIGYRKNRG